MPTLRGADIVVRTLERAGLTDIFTLSGNHIMSLFDAAIGTSLSLMHVRHEAATVHMADAYGRLTGTPRHRLGHRRARPRQRRRRAVHRARPGNADGAAVRAIPRPTSLGKRRFPGTAAGGDGRTGQQGRLDGDRHRHASAWMSRTRSASPHPADLGRCISACRPTCWTRRWPKTRSHWPTESDFVASPVLLTRCGGRYRREASGRQRSGHWLSARPCWRTGAAGPAAPDRNDLWRSHLYQRRASLLQRRYARRLRDDRGASRRGAAAGQGARFHLEVWWRAVPDGLSFRCHRSGWCDPGPRGACARSGVWLRGRYVSGGRDAAPPRHGRRFRRSGLVGRGTCCLQRPPGGMGGPAFQNARQACIPPRCSARCSHAWRATPTAS